MQSKGYKRLLFTRGRGTMLLLLSKIKTIIYKMTVKTSLKQRLFTPAAALVLLASFALAPIALADQFDEQIKQIQADNDQKQATVGQLQVQAETYQGEIDRLQAQIDVIQAQIRENEAKRDDLEKQIEAAQAELEKQKKLLGSNIKAMYVEGDITTLEMLASSKDLSEFLDRQQYRTSVQQKIKTTLDKVTELKAQLREQKTQVEKLLADQQTMNQQLGASRSQQAGLLAYTENQKAQYNAQIKTNNSNIAALRAQQAAANRRLGGRAEAGDPGHGGYPAYLDHAPQDSLIDPWGMYNRECVSYTAWKVFQTYGYMPYWGGHGNANQWPASADAAGAPTRLRTSSAFGGGFYERVLWARYVGRRRLRQRLHTS